MELLNESDRTLNRLRELQPIPNWLIRTLRVVGQPYFWLAVLCVALWQATHFQPWNTSVAVLIVAPVVGVLYYFASRLMRDIEPDLRGLPAETDEDRDLQLAVERLTRNGGVIRVCQREVINAYMRAHYGKP